MKNFKVGDWTIGPPNNFPIRITKILGTTEIEGMITDGSIGCFDFNKDDDFASDAEIMASFIEVFVDKRSDDDFKEMFELNEDSFNCSYDIDTDTFFVNGIAMYKDGKFIDLL